ncbi:MAG: lysylphosphatidylglycerol synthase transmembrane domain-containing protein [Myxococcota bacterium]|nr:lysylphosphatidylglycerol synthase transmembrane domain-containing protein [Myxococcota bacterium]
MSSEFPRELEDPIRTRSRWLDPRLWISVAITGAALWYAFRDVDFAQLGREMARADLWWLIPGSVATYVGSIWVRALRWRYLLRALGEFENAQLFRAMAVGFMANNLFPFRVGELVRSWFLAQETGRSGAAVLGTVIVERVIDAVVVLALAALVLGSAGARASGVDPGQALVVLSLVASVPLVGVVLLRIAPDFCIGVAMWPANLVLPARWAARLQEILRQIANGLSSLRPGWDLVWVVIHTLFAWIVLATLPMYLAIRSLGVDLGGLTGEISTAFLLTVLVGAAVAVPSAPGFAGTYHAACKAALVPLGVAPEVALALGTLAHLVFWVSMTAAGLLALRSRGKGLSDAMAASPPPPPDGSSASR